MTSRDFCFWLQGFFEVGGYASINAHQTDIICKHLALVFKHEIDPSYGPPEHQEVLNKIHDPVPPPKVTGYQSYLHPDGGGVNIRC